MLTLITLLYIVYAKFNKNKKLYLNKLDKKKNVIKYTHFFSKKINKKLFKNYHLNKIRLYRRLRFAKYFCTFLFEFFGTIFFNDIIN